MEDAEQSIIWRRLDMPGHESARIYSDEEGRYLDGAAIFLFEDRPCRLEYLIQCTPEWETSFVSIDGWVGDEIVELEIEANADGVWTINDETITAVEGCTDIDLNFSPITNLLPVRRLDLAVGRSEKVRAAWLRFPSFKLEKLDQIYTRIDGATVRYESGGGSFSADIKVNDAGLPIEYPEFWTVQE